MQKIYGKFRKIMVGGKKQEPKKTEKEMIIEEMKLRKASGTQDWNYK